MTPHPILTSVDWAGLRARRAFLGLGFGFGPDGRDFGKGWARDFRGVRGVRFRYFNHLIRVFGLEGQTGRKNRHVCARVFSKGLGGTASP